MIARRLLIGGLLLLLVSCAGPASLHNAILAENFDRANKLVADGYDVNATDPGGFTPLEYATTYKRTKSVVWLLDRGVNVDARDGNGRTALLKASRLGYDEIAKLLLLIFP